MISADVKALKANELSSDCIVNFFITSRPPKLEIQCKKDIYFSFNFGWYSIHLDIVLILSAENREWVGEGSKWF